MRQYKAKTYSTMLCSSILNHPPVEGPFKSWLMMFPDHWYPVLQHNYMSVKDVSMLIVVYSKQSEETLTSKPEHDDKVITLYF